MYLLLVSGLDVGEIAFGLDGEPLDPRPHVLLRQFEDLARTAVAICDRPERYRFFFGMPIVPKLIQAVEEQLSSDFGFFLTAESINGLGARAGAGANLDK